jgi:hypothetical protein
MQIQLVDLLDVFSLCRATRAGAPAVGCKKYAHVEEAACFLINRACVQEPRLADQSKQRAEEC